MATPELSIIVATRNRVEYLEVALRSLVAQRCDATLEIVVVDNGSSDATAELLDRWRASEPRIRVVREEHPGLSRAKNAGVRAARAPVLAFTDDDVVASPGWAASLLDGLRAHTGPLVVVGGRIVPVPHDLGAWPPWFVPAALADVGLLELPEGHPVRAPRYVWGANMALRAELFSLVGGWNESVGRVGDERGTYEDTELQDRLRAAGGSVWFRSDAVVEHRVDRTVLTPRHVVLQAFARGGYEARLEERRRSLREHRALASITTTASVAVLFALALAFRVAPLRAVFAALHRVARDAGRALEALEGPRRSVSSDGPVGDRVSRAIRRGVWATRRLVPDRAPVR